MNHFHLNRCFVSVIIVVGGLLLTQAFATGPLTLGRPPVIELTRDVLTGTLDDSAPRDLRRQCLYRTHDVHLIEGYSYVIDMTSADFETLLMLEDPNGTLVATDDDPPCRRGSRIDYLPTVTGWHRLIATATTPSAEGDYRIIAMPRDGPHNMVLDVRDFLSLSDPAPEDHHRKAYRISMVGGRSYTINLTSSVFDTCLRMERMDGAIVGFDDAGCLGSNARIRFHATEDADVRIVVTSLAPRGAGPFALRVCEE